MAIKINISRLMGIHKLNMSQLSAYTNIDPRTISRLYYEETSRIEISQINALCKALNCTVADIFEYIPDEEVTQ